ncbi:MAG: response regulator [Marinilabiliaceae bacterium]|nr:response regulator [Marinilabiliaceae bacterium]
MYKYFIIVSLFLSQSSFSENKILRFRQLTAKDGLAQNGTIGIAQDKYGFMWFGTWSGLCRYDGYEFTTYHNHEGDSTSIVNDRILSVYNDSVGDIWISFVNDMQICKYNYDQDNFIRFLFDEVDQQIADSLRRYKPFVRSIAQTHDYKWLVEYPENRLEQINKRNGEKTIYKPDPFNNWAINSEFVGEIYLDDNGILWVSTIGSGVNFADTKQKGFQLYRSSVFSNEIRAFCKDRDQNIWVGTRSNGIGVLDTRNKTFNHCPVEKNEAMGENTYSQIRKMYCDRFGYIWIGTKAGLRKYDPKNKIYTDYNIYSKSRIPHNWVFEIMEDHNGDLWIGTFWGFSRYNREDDSFQYYEPKTMLSNHKVRAIKEDNEFNLWVATEEGGLTCLKRKSHTDNGPEDFIPTYYRHNVNDSNSISSDNIYSMDIDEKGQIWLATSNGLNVFDPKMGHFKCLSVNEGIPDKMIMAVLCDQDGYTWISHTKGLSRIQIDNFIITSYTDEDGLQDKDFMENSCFRDTVTGELYFGGTNGLNVFHPSKIEDNTIAPRVYTTALYVLNKRVEVNEPFNGRVILSKPVYLTQELTLEHQDRTISFDFAGIHFSNPRGNRYKYKLEGFDDEWIYTNASKRTASYSNLRAGNYTFKLLAANSDGVWCDQPATLSIKVLPPWWLSGWTYVGYFILILLLFYLIIRIITAQEKYKQQIEFEKLKADKLLEFDNLKSKFFTNMAHELRTPLSLIIDPLEKVINDSLFTTATKNYFLLMQRNAKRLYKLTNQLLDFRKMETGQLNLVKSVNDMVFHLYGVYESFSGQAVQRNITYQFQTTEKKLLVEYDVEKIESVLYNLISNAFKYTPDNGAVTLKLTVVVANNEEVIVVEVVDTGKGINSDSINNIFSMFYKEDDNGQPGDKSYGIGLAFTKELVELHGGTIAVESEPGRGACFKVTLPYKYVEDSLPEIGNDGSNTDLTIAITNKPVNEYDPQENENDIKETSLLVIEDNDDIRNYLISQLSATYLVHDATNGLEGFDKAIDCLPDLIVSDVMMPGMDGFELCRKLKTDVRTSHIPVILLTARQSDESIIEGYQTGADAYIVKPFNSLVLISRIQNLINSRSQLRHFFGKGNILDTKAITNNTTDEAFVNKAIKIIIDHLEDTGFNSETLADKLKMSRALMYKKIKSLTDMTVHQFIITVKMNKAAELLLSGDYSVSEVAYKVGFTVAGNFTRTFTKQFGCSPSEYISKQKK